MQIINVPVKVYSTGKRWPKSVQGDKFGDGSGSTLNSSLLSSHGGQFQHLQSLNTIAIGW